MRLECLCHPLGLSPGQSLGRPVAVAIQVNSPFPTRFRKALFKLMRWSPKTGQVAKRKSPFGTAGWPEVRHGKYTEEAQS